MKYLKFFILCLTIVQFAPVLQAAEAATADSSRASLMTKFEEKLVKTRDLLAAEERNLRLNGGREDFLLNQKIQGCENILSGLAALDHEAKLESITSLKASLAKSADYERELLRLCAYFANTAHVQNIEELSAQELAQLKSQGFKDKKVSLLHQAIDIENKKIQAQNKVIEANFAEEGKSKIIEIFTARLELFYMQRNLAKTRQELIDLLQVERTRDLQMKQKLSFKKINRLLDALKLPARRLQADDNSKLTTKALEIIFADLESKGVVEPLSEIQSSSYRLIEVKAKIRTFYDLVKKSGPHTREIDQGKLSQQLGEALLRKEATARNTASSSLVQKVYRAYRVRAQYAPILKESRAIKANMAIATIKNAGSHIYALSLKDSDDTSSLSTNQTQGAKLLTLILLKGLVDADILAQRLAEKAQIEGSALIETHQQVQAIYEPIKDTFVDAKYISSLVHDPNSKELPADLEQILAKPFVAAKKKPSIKVRPPSDQPPKSKSAKPILLKAPETTRLTNRKRRVVKKSTQAEAKLAVTEAATSKPATTKGASHDPAKILNQVITKHIKAQKDPRQHTDLYFLYTMNKKKFFTVEELYKILGSPQPANIENTFLNFLKHLDQDLIKRKATEAHSWQSLDKARFTKYIRGLAEASAIRTAD
jgi:hypothetical protein